MTSENVLEQVAWAYRRAIRRILFLDYDGTLVPFNDDPQRSGMGEEVRSTLTTLAGDPRNTLYIISGRKAKFLDGQFNGINVGLIAEHGFLKREADGDWVVSGWPEVGWKSAAVEPFNKSSARSSGTFTEETEFSVACHY